MIGALWAALAGVGLVFSRYLIAKQWGLWEMLSSLPLYCYSLVMDEFHAQRARSISVDQRCLFAK